MLSALLAMTTAGALDATLVAHANFYSTDYTRPLLFLGDSATAGNWPGQPWLWLWLYTMWYHVPPMSSSGNADVLVLGIMALLSLVLLLLPFIPGLRSIPRWVPVHRLIWRRYYHEHRS